MATLQHIDIGIILVAVISVIALLWCDRNHPPMEWLFKPLASVCFVLLAMSGGAQDSTYGALILGGLCLSVIGDLMLIPKNEKAFTFGLSAFLLAHLFYAAAFLQLPVNTYGLLMSVAPAGILGIATVRWLYRDLPAKRVTPVFTYIVVICLVLVAAGGTWKTGLSGWILVGAWGFAASDLSVAGQQFKQAGLRYRAWGLPLYFASQMMLAWSARLI
ncbi:YhhN-like protein [Luminiphilus syltensis NOR5-1B]|uniref:YhhN-like protein n=1 Tax=Luminiphilus syltensis NOR5-1B TaxID=565045 RepID=B8KXA1_9GAMM|nr:lysoplasmalogenase [Luminiphilus syltensis]EED34546.1 YhhN-like protein [Luminiphilus syltensis NOR5-1B]